MKLLRKLFKKEKPRGYCPQYPPEERNREHLYLTDEQYIELLYKCREMVQELIEKGDSPWVYDSTRIGNKYTTSNVGLCNEEELCTREDLSLFSDNYSLKYTRNGQACPFDQSFTSVSGCYYRCILRENITAEKALELVNWAISKKEGAYEAGNLSGGQ